MTSTSVRQLFLLLALDVYHSFTAGQESTTLSYSIREEQMNKTFVGNVARDSLLYGNVTPEEFSHMRFQILTQGNKNALLFTINETSSSLYTDDVLDREVLCPYQKTCFLNFNVAVYKKDPSNGLLDLYKIFQINVSLEDTNDNMPVFPKSEVFLTVEESVSEGYVLYTSAADDKDTGFNNSVQTYELVPSNEMFGLDVTKNLDGSSDLGLVVNYKLDRETRDFYELKIYARDGGFPQRTGTLTVNITVSDFNDNRPLFKQPTYKVNVPENQSVKTPILSLSASDADIGENGLFSFRFNSRVLAKITDIFAVNETTGQIHLISGLNYEDDREYKFLVEVVDHGRIPLSSSAMVTVEVVDVNDNSPQINTNFPPGGTVISESAEVGRYVATVSVSDKDLGANGKVLCQILGEKFKLEELYTNMYKIVVSQKLDYETQKSHNITLTCQDQGIPQQQNTTTFTIYVKDENDNAPVFHSNMYRASILENLLTFQEIVHTSATDKDSGDNGKVTYFLHTDAGDNFTINPQTGIVKTNNVFDREEESEVRFHVNASDNGSPDRLVSSTLVILTLDDVNDNPPTFTKPKFTFKALEGQENEPVIGTLTANDLDAGSNGQFTFDFLPPIPTSFAIDPQTGVIKSGNLDREVQSSYNFTVRVTDKGNPVLFSTAAVTVNVFDDNDNPPIIHMPNSFNDTFYVPYTAMVGTVIVKINATDNDLGQNARLLYYIDSVIPSNKNLFKLDTNSGLFTVAKTMHLYDSDSYRVLISVKDSGYSQQVSYMKFSVIVTLTNDTSLMVKTKEEPGTNLVIVAVIIVVTIILSAAIIVTIIVLRRLDIGHRRDRNNRDKHDKRMCNSNHNETISTESSQFSDAPLKKKNKKEVSFSLSDESDSVNTSTFTNITSFSMSKHPTGIISLDGKLIENPQACSSLITNNTLNSEKSKDSYGDKQYQIDCLSYQPDHHRPQSPGYWYQQLKEQEAREMELRIKNDDAHSETSAESATSDSGRGGSEEDIHSNRGHPLSDTDEPYKVGNHSSKNSSILHSSFDTPIKSKITKNNDYPRNISFSDDSVTANTTVDELKSKYAKRKEALMAAYLNPHLPNFSQSGISAIQTPQYRGYPGRAHLDTLDEASHSAFGLRYSIQDIDTMSDSIATRDDDGASTTTSGSYTINPDELVNEIDNLFFNSDVIV